MIISTQNLNDSFLLNRKNYYKNSNYFYLFILLISALIFISLPYIFLDISIKTTGITRPDNERTEVKSSQSGVIEGIYVKEGSLVKAGDILLRIKDPNSKSKKILNQYELSQRNEFIHDIAILVNQTNHSENDLKNLLSPVYKEQLSKFLFQKEQQLAALKKANQEVEMNTSLAHDKVISKKEFFDIQNNHERILSAYNAFIREQISTWQQELVKYKLESSQYQLQSHEINSDASFYEVRAATGGIIQGINTKYAGGTIVNNEIVCTISPEGDLIGECYVQSRDIGLLKLGQKARFQIEAFDYNYFGVLTGKIVAIDNDFTVINNTPVFKVRCSFDSTLLKLKNGFTGQLKKGMNFQARFIVDRRSLWQLLFDNLNDWLNPIAPPKTNIASN
ncbi:MAG: HlyD family efflux transporter periplasmic adaptor subunit [Sphingobacteriia bacterium]|nr:MAG: HlyD family efflux transporter periplasmic adaptor subunit [Sphingobacteriia bacterium]TAG30380.1 MAG: HlyD family efflux transporter periplasmic adaptor subunit [Sphingobacteriia bacterium]